MYKSPPEWMIEIVSDHPLIGFAGYQGVISSERWNKLSKFVKTYKNHKNALITHWLMNV